MSRVSASLFKRLPTDLFTSSRARRLKRQKRRAASCDIESRKIAALDVALEKRLLLSAVTVAVDDVQVADVVITAVDEVDPSADFLTVNDGIRVESTGGSVTLNAGDHLNLGVGSTIAAASSINLNLDVADADFAVGATATLQNLFVGTAVSLTGGPDDDSVILSPSSFDDVAMNIDLMAGSGNSLEIDLTGVTNPVLTYVGANGGTITSSSHETITFANVQSVDIATGTGTFDEVVISLGNLVVGDDASDDTTTLSVTSADISVNVNGSELVSFPQASVNAITVNGSSDNDLFKIDHSGGLITVPINVSGGAGDDLASVKGDNTESAVYTPDVLTTGNGIVTVTNAGTLTFSGLEPVDISNMATATLTLPSGSDSLSIDEDFDFTTGAIPALVVSGTSAGVIIESAAFFNNGSLVIDTSTTDGTDTVFLNAANNGHGNGSLTIAMGGTASDGDLLNLNGNATFADAFSVSGASITLLTDVTVSAGGTLSFGTGALDGAFGLSLTGGDVLLTGTIGGVTPLSSLSIASSGNTVVGANISASGGITIRNDAVFSGGIALAGAPVTLQADISPGGFGDDTDLLTVFNNLVLSDRTGDDLTMHVNGKSTAGVDFDQLVVVGSVTLDGQLNIVDTFADTGVSGDEIVLIENDGSDAVVGTFSNYANGDVVTLNGQDWRLLYDGGDGNDISLRFGSDTSISINDAIITEGDTGTSVLTFTVTSSTAIGQTFRVTYATADNTAESATDYSSTNSVINFLGTTSGETQTISINVGGDALVERHETLLLTLTNILDTANATIADGIGIGTITNDDTATVTINSAQSEEGDSGTRLVVFTVSLDTNVDTSFTLDYATADGSATGADSDYVSASGTLNFTGITPDVHSVSVEVNGDTTPEFDEVFDVLLSNLSTAGRNVVLASSSTEGTIVDDDRVPVELSMSTSSGNESDQTVITITATADQSVSGAQSIGIAVAGIGISASDYTLSNPTIQIADGETTGAITLTIADDEIVELTELATVSFENPTGGIRVGNIGSALLSIASDDVAGLTISAGSRDETDTGTTTVTFDVTLDKTVDSAVSVDFATADGTATTADTDYDSTTGTLNFAGTSGEVQTISVVVHGDEVVELDEVFLVALSNLNGGGRPVTLSNASAVGTIANDDTATLSIADVTASESDSGTTSFDFVVSLSKAVDTYVTTVPLATDDTATTADFDYSPLALQTIRFVGTAGEQHTVSVTVNGDRLVESDEAFQVLLSSLQASGRAVTFGDDTAVGTIVNDDRPVPVNLAASVLTGTEASATVITLTATADEVVGGDQIIQLSLTGIDSADATLSSTTITIPDGQAMGSVTLTVANDDIVEAIETAVVTMNSVSVGLELGATTSASISIVDDDAATIRIDDISIQEGDSGTTDFEFVVSLSAMVDGLVSLNYATTTSTALASDFTAASGATSFAALSMESQTITVSVTGDDTVELDEEFLMNLSGLNASGLNVTFADNQGRATIVNEDQATLSINDVAVSEGDAGTSVYRFNVSLSHDVDSAVSVDYSTANGTAIAPTDYTSISSNTIAFSGAAGEIEAVQILVVAETLQEVDETFFVDLLTVNASGRNVVIDKGRGTGTIIDDDGVKVNLSAIAASGGEAGGSTITLTATAASTVAGTQLFHVDITGDRVTASDYSLSSNTISIADGESTGTVTFTVADDNLTEILETATATISGFPAALSAGTTTSVDIDLIDNDQTTLTIADVSIAEGNSGTATMTFTVVADNAVDSAFSVDLATADGTATTADFDFTAVAQTTLNFTGIAGQEMTLTVDVIGDGQVELDETILVNLMNVQAAGRNVVLARATATGTITNDDSATLSIMDLRQVEGNSGTSVFALDVILSGDVDRAFTVDYRSIDGTAAAGTDFNSVSGATLSFAGTSGEVQTAMVAVVGDTDAERDEVFQVVLENLTGLDGRSVSIDDGTADVVIADDDGVIVNFGVNATSGSEVAGTVITLVVSAAQPLAQAETVDLVVTGTDIDGNDYSLSASSITITAGQTIGTAMFTILDDSLVENPETAVISIVNPSIGLALGAVTTQSVSITSEDNAALTVVDQTVVEGNTGTTSVTYSVVLSHAVTTGFTVSYATSDDTATTAGGDYSASSGALAFSGTALEVQTFTVVVNGDTDLEGDETYLVTLSNLVGGSMAISLPASPATGTITNDDGATEVNVGLSASSGTEADQTVVIITATTELPVVGDQSVSISLSGSNITAADFNVSSMTIVIPNGQTTGSVTLQVLDDSNIEAPTETLTVNLTAPTAGLILGSMATAELLIQDNSTVVLDVIDRFQTGRPTLTWQEVSGATGYEVWFSRIFPNVEVLEVDRNVNGTSWQVPESLDAAMYRYWIRAKDADGDFTAWSAANQFEVRPNLISPIGGAFTRTLTFQWEAIPFATAYELYLSSSNGVQRIGNLVGTSYTPTEDLPEGEVRWWIRAEEALGNRGWSAVGFASSEVKPVLLAPVGGTMDAAPTFRWSIVPGAGRYVLYVQNTDTSEVIINDATITSTSHTPATDLAAGNYRCWVKAIDAESNAFNSGLWSNPLDFIVADASAAEVNEDQPSSVFVRVNRELTSLDSVEGGRASEFEERSVDNTQYENFVVQKQVVASEQLVQAPMPADQQIPGNSVMTDAGGHDIKKNEAQQGIDVLMSESNKWSL